MHLARAVECRFAASGAAADSLFDCETSVPDPGGRDLLVRITAVSVNPIDTKVRRRMTPDSEPRVLGWDAAGTVVAAGPAAEFFSPGDQVYYAGTLVRPGSNCELQIVDERLVGRLPDSLDAAAAAAVPLTAITAWELLVDRMGVTADSTVLIVGAAGGVGSMAVQLAKDCGSYVVGTASRSESQEWVTSLGADLVIDHHQSLADQLADADAPEVSHVALLTHSEQYFTAAAELLAPQGALGMIDDPAQPVDVTLLKPKSLSLHWESMFTRSVYRTPDMVRQHEILNRVADLIDAGQLRSTLTQQLGPISAASLIAGHEQLESHGTIGKLVVSGWPQ